jgi:predicted ATPase
VGRQTELDVLQRALAQAAAGQGQVVALVGEAGVGKSRLVYEIIHSHRAQGWRVLESASVSYGKATPYFPVIELLHPADRDAADAALRDTILDRRASDRRGPRGYRALTHHIVAVATPRVRKEISDTHDFSVTHQ